MTQEPSSNLWPPRPVLLVDDDPAVLLSLDTLLRMEGFNNIHTCNDGRQVLNMLAENDFSVLLLDLTMPYVGGEEILEEVSAEYPELPVVVITGTVDVETAVRCMRRGAYDYLVKPVESDRLITTLERSLAYGDLKSENIKLKNYVLSRQLSRPEAFEAMITNDPVMLGLFKYIENIASSPEPLLITGETGVGKELLAKACYDLSGCRGRFVAVNVAGVDDNVFSDTLFGHLKGAFTGADGSRGGMIEAAEDGVLFLDEVGDLSPGSQAKLLRLLQEGEYFPLGADAPSYSRARIVAATNRSLTGLVKEGRFRRDLNHRLHIHHVHLPPLRQRMGDLPLLVDHFVSISAEKLGRRKPRTPKQLYQLLASYSFPGNVRELSSLIFDAVSQERGRGISVGLLRDKLQKHRRAKADTGEVSSSVHFPGELPTLKECSNILVMEAMRRAGGNQTSAAGVLGISQQALSKRLAKIRQDS